MPRPIWKGAISFGLVNIPVALFAAENRDALRFNQLDRRTMSRVRERRVNEETGEEVPWEDIVAGYDTGGGHYVALTDQDFTAANPRRTRTIDILGFVDAKDIDVVYFEKPYYLTPADTGRKAYTLLRTVLRRSGKVGIAKAVIRTREHLAVLMVRGPMMVLEVLRFAHEIRDPSDMDVPGEDLEAQGVSDAEVAAAERLVAAMVGPWDPQAYRDEYRDDLLRLIQEKRAAGQAQAVTPAEKAPPGGQGRVVDIMTLLKRSIEQQTEERQATGTGGAPGRTPRPRPTRRRKDA